jgi:hypothetical protein
MELRGFFLPLLKPLSETVDSCPGTMASIGSAARSTFIRFFAFLFVVGVGALKAASIPAISVTPLRVSVRPDQKVQCVAAVMGLANTAVTWSISPRIGSISSTGIYTPAPVSSSQTITFTATSVANTAISTSGTIIINPVVSSAPATVSTAAIAVTPLRVSVRPDQKVQCAAAVTGVANTAVTWSISPQIGSISSTGIYTPAPVSSPATITFTATSVANTAISASGSIIINPGILVTVTPATLQLSAGASAQFTASVSGSSNQSVAWSASGGGSISANGVYTAPSPVSSSQSVTISAKSMADNSSAGTAIIQLQPVSAQTTSLKTLATFSLNEMFGVSWPDQPIEFRYDGGQPPANTRMIGPLRAEVPFQWEPSCADTSAVNGCIVVRSNLPANSSYTWTLQSGAAPAATQTNAVTLTVAGNHYQLTNGLTGVRILTAAGNPAPYSLAPIQGILLPNGVWTGAGATPNLLYFEGAANAGCLGCSLRSAMTLATGYSVSIVQSGPLKTVVTATYTFNRPKYSYGSTLINNAGTGHYTITLTLSAKSRSILIDEDSDTQFSYYLPLYSQVNPDQARFRGHDAYSGAGVPDPACGYEPPMAITSLAGSSPIVVTAGTGLSNGQRVAISGVRGDAAANGIFYVKTTGYPDGQFALYSDANLQNPVAASAAWTGGGTVKPAYRGASVTPVADALFDLSYSADYPATYACFTGPSSFGNRKLMVNYPSANHAAGWYEEMYSSAAATTAPVVAIYVGRFSQQNNSALGPSMPGFYSSNRHWISGTRDAGIQVDTLLRAPTAATTPLVHRNWGIFVSTKADLAAISAHQPISDEQNMLTGINLSRIYTYQLTYPDPPGGWKWLYMSPAGAGQLISQVRDGTSVCGAPTCYYTQLKNSEGSIWGVSLLNMWQGNSSAAVQTALGSITSLAQSLMNSLATGDNRFGPFAYYNIGLQSSPATAVLNAILMDSNATVAQKTLAKAELALFGSILWDNDWWPIDNTTGDSVGLANQIQQYLQYRTQSVIADPSQPFLVTKAGQALASPVDELNTWFSLTGAAAGSTHYQSTFFEPLILNYMGLQNTGQLSLADPRWAAYANWELSIQTPPEPRFGNIRKGYSNGDGNTESDVRTGMLATAMNPVNPALAGNLMWAWRQSNGPSILTEDSQFTTTLAVIDNSIPSIMPSLGSINVPGYHTAERHGFGTANETAVWFINGGFYSTGGHRHFDDGQVSIYADSAPLALDFNANLYSPETPGRFLHNSIVYDNELGHSWNADNASLTDVEKLLGDPTNTEFETFPNSTHAVATFTSPDGTVWTRAVRTMAFNPEYPVIYVTDSFSGPSAQTGKTLTWNLMAAGAVATPAGTVTPAVRFSSGCQAVAGQLPSNGSVYGLGQGLSHFSFTGVNWPRHAAGGINWDLYLLSGDAAGQFFLGNWGHGCQSSRETAEFQKANGTAFSEAQHILRVHDTGPFATLLLPFPKTAQPSRTVEQAACGIQIVQGAERTCFNDSAATWTNGTESVLSVYDGSTQSAFGVTAGGGPQEVAIAKGQITWTLSGVAAGVRTVALPSGTWMARPAIAGNGNVFTYAWPGGQQAEPVTVVFKAQ